jgi:hypothetical protein
MSSNCSGWVALTFPPVTASMSPEVNREQADEGSAEAVEVIAAVRIKARLNRSMRSS